jgi:proline iminopeptidase
MTTYPPYEQGYFPVSDGYRLYYERYGNPTGIPVLFLHGGPGAGFAESDKEFFDPTLFNVLLFDQRGAGRSQPFAHLIDNTTPKLVADITQMLDHFQLNKVLLFGGSWGSTLALVYAIQYPERVSAMLLRGIFLASSEALNYFVDGGVAQFFPEVWLRFISHVPEQDDVVGYYLRQMQSDDEVIREKYAYEWSFYEISLVKLEVTPQDVEQLLIRYSYRSMAPLEAHYMHHQCFVTDDFILYHSARLGHLPISIVHGRYDAICLPKHAYQLHQRLPNSQLHFVCAGHSSSEPAIKAKLITELARLGKLLS